MPPPDDSPASPESIGPIDPCELFARGMQSVRMSASGGAHGWEPPDDAEIARLFPNYEMLGLLGRGGMGAVYKARQIEIAYRNVRIRSLESVPASPAKP